MTTRRRSAALSAFLSRNVLVIAACQFGAEMFIARQYVLTRIFVIPLALISTLLVTPSAPGLLLRDRILETIIGAAVGIAVVLAPRLAASEGPPGHPARRRPTD